MKMNDVKQAGFTLVEVLISMFIFSLLSTATLSVLLSTLRTKELLSKKNEELRQIANLRMLLKSDLGQAIAVAKADEYGRSELSVFEGGISSGNQVLSLSRTGWANPAGIERRSDLQSVKYTFDQGVLTRNISARFNAVASTPVYQQGLLSNVESLKFSFYDGKFWTNTWLTGQPPVGVETLPTLARLEVKFDNGTDLRQVFFVGEAQ